MLKAALLLGGLMLMAAVAFIIFAKMYPLEPDR
jgi:hypothetical protein